MIALLVLLLACGPKRELDAVHGELTAARANAAEAAADHAAQVRALQEEADRLRDQVRTLQARVDDLRLESEARRRMVQSLNAEKAALVKDRSTLRASVVEMELALGAMEERRVAADARVAEYRSLLDRFQALIDAGTLQVRVAEGRMVVELATDVLFDSGKAELSPDGQATIAAVATVLAGLPGRSFQVEGHTDDVPIQTERFPSNWELASARAITVVRELVAGGVAPERLSAASRAEFQPAEPNTSEAGRARNRRIEIVLVPDLRGLPGHDELNAASSG